MEKIKKIKIKSFRSISGKLVPISFNKKFPFKIKRIFFYMQRKIKYVATMPIKNVPNFL